MLTGKAVGWLTSQVVALLFATVFLFGSIQVLNGLQLRFFYYIPRIIGISLIEPTVDIFIWAVSSAAISIILFWVSIGWQTDYPGAVLSAVTLFAAVLLPFSAASVSLRFILVILLFLANLIFFSYLYVRSRKSHAESWGPLIASTLTYLFAYLIVIEVATSAFFVTRSFDIESQVGSVDAAIELQLTYVGYDAIPWLYAAFLFSWIWVPITIRLLSTNLRVRQILFEDQISVPAETSAPKRMKKEYLQSLADPRIFLAAAVALFVGYYAYFQSPPWLVGTDAYWRYYDPLTRISASGLGGFAEALVERHPLPLMILYGTHLISQISLFEVVRNTPILLIVLLGIASWWFLGARKNLEFGLLVFLFSVLSMVTTVGLFSSILANWMFLVVWMLFFAYAAYSADRGFRLRDFVPLLLLSTVLLLLHPWSWGVFAVATSLAGFAALLVISGRGRIRGSGTLLAVILVDGAFGIASLMYLASTQGWRVADALSLYSVVFQNPSTALYLWGSVQWLTRFWSAFFSPLYLAVSIIGVFRLHDAGVTPWRRVLVYSWLVAAGVGSVMVAPVGFDPARAPSENAPELWRVLFLTPFQLTVPLAVGWLAGLPVRVTGNPASSQAARNVVMIVMVGLGFVLALSPTWVRLVLLIPPVALLLILKMSGDKNSRPASVLVTSMFLFWFLLVTFNFTLRGLSQLLLDPHNFRP